jgi:hypothetical protein
MSCLAPGYNPNPSKVWSRVQGNCSLFIPTNPITSTEINALQMIRKANVLQYKSNSSNLTKQQQYSLIAQGKYINRTKSWATQTDTYTNPNTTNLKQVDNSLICVGVNQICVPTSSSNVPGPIINLCYNNRFVTYYPREKTIMNTSTNNWTKYIKNIQSANLTTGLQ